MVTRWRRLLARALDLLRGEARSAEIDRDIAEHLAQLEAGFLADGLSPEAARVAARRTFGNVAIAREESAAAWRFGWLDDLVRDLRFGARMLRRDRTVAVVIFLILAVGIGSSTTIYTLVNACILRHDQPIYDRWVIVRGRLADRRTYANFFSIPELADARRLTDVFEDVGAVVGTSFTSSDGDFPERLPATYVTANVFHLLEVPPLVGRTFADDEDRPGAPNVTVLSYRLWQDRFHGDPDIAGRTITLDRRPYTIIGVMPAHYDLWGGALWVPMQLDRSATDRTDRRFWMIAITGVGVSEDRANARLRILAAEFARDHIAARPDYAGMDLEVWNVREAVIGGVKTAMLVLLASAALLLLVACTNVASLLLARATSRAREMSVRTALGAGRFRLVRQLVAESLLLAGAGGAAGILAARSALPVLVHLIPPEYLTTDADLIRVDLQAVLVTAAVSVAVGVLFGVVPALRVGRGTGAPGLTQRGTARDPGAGRIQRGLAIAQVALTLVVAIAAALTIEGYRAAERTSLGFNPNGVISFHIALPQGHGYTPPQMAGYYDRVLATIETAPGVTAVAAATDRPLGYRMVDVAQFEVSVVGRPVPNGAPVQIAACRVVNTGYFRAMQTPLVAGREFTISDNFASPAVAVINDTMARLFWPGGDALGGQLRLGPRHGRPALAQMGVATVAIVGIVRDSKQTRVIDAPVRPEMFLPLDQHPEETPNLAIMVRSMEPPQTMVKTLREAVLRVDDNQPIFDVEALPIIVADAFGPKRLTTVLLLFFASVAIALAAVGLYGVVNFGVTQRTQEIGVRVAIGADRRAILAMILGSGIRMALAGIALGAAVAIVATRFMTSELSGVNAGDPLTFAAAAVFLLVVAAVATALPARRASRVDPIVALRAE